ncbi:MULTISPECIES: polysaccharide biosynthesis/export family protein [unclassified Xanthobacter]|uniref:polysaccharide biosynthesis/export family protein n=1 Tax=unclassified Xanthobacter TaxID=2623496 RepID=UPI001F30D884|nr:MULTISPECIES: polysaccharide biosynthesis/export family protein [unclassified Xanthobacter]
MVLNWLRSCRLALGETLKPAHALLALAMGAALGLAGCETPRSGPMASEIQQESENPGDFPFRLVPVDVAVSRVLLRNPDDSMSTNGFFRSDRKAGGPVLGPGDTLAITVMEPASGGVFSGINSQTAGGQSAALVTLPDMSVDSQGTISFPLVGSVHVSGLTTRQVQLKLEEELKSRIIQPQVIVRLVGNSANKVIIAGAVKAPGEFDVTAAGETLLQLVTRAGGPTVAPSDVIVELTRNGTTRSVRLQALINQPTSDVKLKGGDFINISVKPRIYLIMGAAGRTTEAPLPPEQLTLANALARNGGLQDTRADVRGVFVLRYEPKRVVSQLTPDQPADTPYVPVVYQFNFQATSGFFLADSFVLRDRDIIYLSNAPSVEMQKFLELFRVAVSPAISAVGVAASINNL